MKILRNLKRNNVESLDQVDLIIGPTLRCRPLSSPEASESWSRFNEGFTDQSNRQAALRDETKPWGLHESQTDLEDRDNPIVSGVKGWPETRCIRAAEEAPMISMGFYR